MRPIRVLVAIGTRPEVIKLAPVVEELRSRGGKFEVIVCATAQHREMLDQAAEVFSLRPDIDLDLMAPGQDIFDLTSRVLLAMRGVLAEARPDIVLVQGDTTTAFTVALAAFYSRCRVAHVEAGLRSGDRAQPYPEELNRILAGALSDLHFAPTERARQNLLRSGVPPELIEVTGNTVIDALLGALPRARALGANGGIAELSLEQGRRLLLITGHRRENFGEGVASMCDAIAQLARQRDDLEIVYPVHLNPNVRGPVMERLSGLPRLHLIAPQPYLPFLWLMDRAHVILSDSGGVQEEAPALGRPVLVMREVTERPEAVEIGAARLVGTDTKRIVDGVCTLLDDSDSYRRMAGAGSPFGDGKASARIAERLERYFA